MPCDCTGFSKPRTMDPDEYWKSLSRHHIAVEQETETLRQLCENLIVQIDSIKKMFPGINLIQAVMPEKTPEWTGKTYRDKDGKWPSDIIRHVDWLCDQDFKKD